MRYAWAATATLVALALTATPAQTFWRHHVWVHHHGHPVGPMVAPSGVVGSQGITQFLPLIQIGADVLQKLLEQRQQQPPPAKMCTVPDQDMKKITDSLTALDRILDASKKINPKLTP